MSFIPRAHPQQIRRRDSCQLTLDGLPHDALDLSADSRATPPDDFARFDARWHFTLDVAATAENAKCPRFYTVEDDGLSQPWAGERVWCNPPFSHIRPWIEKAWNEVRLFPWGGLARGAPLIVMLLPANRTEQKWWQELVEPARDRPGAILRTEFLPRRIDFIAPGKLRGEGHTPFGCVLLIWQMPGSRLEEGE
jgi:phage N-6-adenine-methyltransferase